MTTPPLPFDALGGLDGVRALVDRFYDLMDSSPEAADVRRLHAESLKRSREKLTEYLTGWTGGPPLYETKYGHPRLRARHLPFAIGTRERDQWLWCMERALAAHSVPDEVRAVLWPRLRQLADFMSNQDEPPTSSSAAAPVPIEVTSAQPTILLVEDDAAIRAVAQRVLEREGYRVLTAAVGEDAVGIVNVQGDRIALIVSDLQLPGISGVEIARRVRESHPRMPIILATGSTTDEIAAAAEQLPDLPFLTQPFTASELLSAVRLALGPHH
jgi:hemoglobin